MLIFHNRISKEELKKRFLFSKKPRITISFYKYFNIVDVQKYRDDIYRKFLQYQVLGRVYIANEGINAQISVPIEFYSIIKIIVKSFDSALRNIRINESLSNNSQSFWVLSIKIKKNIVADGIHNSEFDHHDIGTYLKANEVNKMIKSKNTILVDMRNYYEYKIGHFKGAINIKSQTFREQLGLITQSLDYAKNKKIIMYCTGGIRCEKATAWMKFHGFKNIYHIEGGIIGYVSNAKKNNLPILFKGKMFVFDYRMSEKISNHILSTCHQCDKKEDTYTNCAYHKCHLLFIQCHACSIRFSNCCSITCRNKIVLKI